MKILVAPNALKDCLTASAAAAALARGAARAAPFGRVVQLPVADGGDGLLEILIPAMAGAERQARVTGPRGDPLLAAFGHVPARRLAVIELASASGLARLPSERRDPLLTTTRGTGELMAAALELGIEQLIVGLGGSATCDGGVGMAAALGIRFLDAAGQPIVPGGGGLTAIRRIDPSGLDARLAGVSIVASCDVDSPLLGALGAARVYGPQKGATPAQVELLEAGLAHLAMLIERDLGQDLRDRPGAGAAGGAGAGLLAFFRARLQSGSALVLDLLRLDDHLRDADLVLTAEGRLDAQTARGKAPAAVAARARARGIPCIAIAGQLDGELDRLHELGITAAFSLCPGPIGLDRALAAASEYLAAAAEQAVRAFQAGRPESVRSGLTETPDQCA